MKKQDIDLSGAFNDGYPSGAKEFWLSVLLVILVFADVFMFFKTGSDDLSEPPYQDSRL